MPTYIISVLINTNMHAITNRYAYTRSRTVHDTLPLLHEGLHILVYLYFVRRHTLH